MTDITKRELTLTRTVNAPASLVYKAWTDPELLAKWWGPKGVTNPTCEFEHKVGGNIHIVMLAGEELGELKGNKWPMKGVVKEIIESEKLVYSSQAIDDATGEAFLDSLVTVTFSENEGKTDMKVHILVTNTTSIAEGPLKGMEIGWNQSLDKLSEFIQAQNEGR